MWERRTHATRRNACGWSGGNLGGIHMRRQHLHWKSSGRAAEEEDSAAARRHAHATRSDQHAEASAKEIILLSTAAAPT